LTSRRPSELSAKIASATATTATVVEIPAIVRWRLVAAWRDATMNSR
jgi:hypothetical protein